MRTADRVVMPDTAIMVGKVSTGMKGIKVSMAMTIRQTVAASRGAEPDISMTITRRPAHAGLFVSWSIHEPIGFEKGLLAKIVARNFARI